MKSLFSRSLFAAFLVVAGYAGSFAQTTVTLPTIPCSNCNGPGAFSTTAPACTSGLLGAPLTMSWGTASGATSYTIMIATDANLSQNVATFTTTGTSVTVPAIGLAPSTTYYWTVFANSASGSTKATGGPCTFSTNTTWTGGSPTGGFPNGSPSQQILANGISGGYYDCRSGDGTCASGDNLICNPRFQLINSSSFVIPNWSYLAGMFAPVMFEVIANAGGVTLPNGSVSVPPSGATSAMKLGTYSGRTAFMALQIMFEQNTTSNDVNYRLTYWAVAGSAATLQAGFFNPQGGINSPDDVSPYAYTAQATIGTTWAQYNRTITFDAGAKSSYFVFYHTAATSVYVTDAVLCKL